MGRGVIQLVFQNWTYIFVALFSVAGLLWICYARLFHPLAKYPGPFLASITRWWLIFDVSGGSTEKTQRQLHTKYGPIVRIAPDEVAISDPEAIKDIYGIHNRFTKTDFYLPFRASWCRQPDIFTTLDERQHAERRRIVNSLYSMTNIIQLEEKIDTCFQMLLERFTERAETGQIVDVATWVQWYAFDVIGQLFFSRMFGFMKGAHDYEGYIRALDLLIPMIAIACVMPSYMRPLYLISGALFPSVFKALRSLKHIERASETCVAERSTLLATANAVDIEQDMLQSFFNIMKNSGKKKDFGLTEIKQEVYGAFIAGSDTTAATITAILYFLMRHPDAYNKLTAEIDEAASSGLLSTIVQYHEAIGLLYLVACVKEGMRLHPSVGMTLPRYVPKNGCCIAGEWFPEGTRVGVNAATIHMNKGIFGEDAEEFVPERWFRKDAVKMERYMFQFGGGTRTCIGKNISLCAIYKVVPQLLREFKLELLQADKEWVTHNHWFNKPSKVYVRLHLRKSELRTP